MVIRECRSSATLGLSIIPFLTVGQFHVRQSLDFFGQGRNVCDELLQRRGWFDNQETLVGGGEGAAQGSGAD